MIYIDLTVSTPEQHVEMCKALGKRIKQVRTHKKMSQITLATMCNFEKSNLSRIEAGGTNPTFLTIYKISSAIGVPMAELLHDIEQIS